MTPSKRIVIGTLIFFLIMGASFAAGFYFNFKARTEPANGLTAYQEKPRAINNKTYKISPPSIGAAIRTQKIAVQFIDGASSTPLTAAEADAVKTGMTVLLYNQPGQLLGVTGKVTAVGGQPKDTKDNVFITIALTDRGIVLENILVKGEIITQRDTSAARLPKDAIVQDDKGATFAWEVNTDQDGISTGYLKAIKIMLAGDSFLAIEMPYGSSNVFILDPDKKLQDGQKINVQKVLYAGPENTREQLAEAAMQQFLEQRLKASQFMDREKAFQQRQLNAAACGTGGESLSQQFIDKIKALTAPPTNPSPPPEISLPAPEPAL